MPPPGRSGIPAALAILAVAVNAAACLSGFVIGDLRPHEFHLGLLMFGWTSFPWLAHPLLARKRFGPAIATVIGLLMMGLSAAAFSKVLFFPTSSTDAMAVMVMPLIQMAMLASVQIVMHVSRR